MKMSLNVLDVELILHLEIMNKFKPFDRIIYRYKGTTNSIWIASEYSHETDVGHYLSGGNCLYKRNTEILPFEGNEHLVGTLNDPKQKITLQEGECIVCGDDINDLSNKYGFISKFKNSIDDYFVTSEDCYYDYCIPFSQFDINLSKEELEKRILYVEDDKIQYYKK